MTIQDATVPAPEGEWIEPPQEPEGSRVRRALAGILPEDVWSRPPRRTDSLPEGAETHDRGDDSSPLYEPSETGVSTASTEALVKGKASKAARELYATIGRTLVAAGGGLANMAARDDDEDPVWLLTQDEADGIAVPLANIAARKAPLNVGDSSDTNDLVDGLTALLGLALYATRNLMERSTRRRALRQAAQLQPADA